MGNDDPETSDEVRAFLLTLGSGLATTIGAALALCVDAENKLVFACCLALAAGVMTYVSFVEIFFKSRDEYEAWELEEADANTAATLTFFFGLLASVLLEFVTNKLFHRHQNKNGGCSDIAAAFDKPVDKPSQLKECSCIGDCTCGSADVTGIQLESAVVPDTPGGKETEKASKVSAQEKLNMLQMAVFSGIAIAAHNFPEGLATFVAAVEDPAFGASMAIAIAIHNVPEGLVVAIPILKATGSKRKAFLWAFLSGVAEPIGAGLGWLALREVIGPLVYAMLFGVIGGVMVHISFRKLLPTALRYDPENVVTSYAFFAGMGVMAASLVAFGY